MLTHLRRAARPTAGAAVLSLIMVAAPAPASAGPIPSTPKDCFGHTIATARLIYASSGAPNGRGGYTVYGTSGDDVILGTPGPDDLYGNGGTDVICGGDGDDYIDGAANPNPFFDYLTADGEDGDDSLNGGAGGDVLYGGAGDDLINGGNGDDDLHGQIGADIIEGWSGMDTINCGDTGDNHFSAWGAFQPGDVADGGTETPFGIDPVLAGSDCETSNNIP